jgi:glycosyltransferase involved in cell wall biosynthesis
MTKNRILFILDSLEGGGAQRVALNILHCINKHVFEPSLAVINCKGDYQDLLPRDITVHDLQARRARFALFKLARLIDTIKPEILYSTTPYVDEIACFAAKLSRHKMRIILRSPNYLSAMLRQLPIYTRLMARYSYRRADLIITTTRLMTRDLQDKFGISANRIKLIHNPLDLEMIQILSKEDIDHPWFQNKNLSKIPVIISMGRLVDQKGFPDLIRAFAVVTGRLPARLVILGQGKNLERLQALARKIGIDRSVWFAGFQSNPYKYLVRSRVFVLPSYWEGFPNSLVEAMACGIPVVSTDCPSGPAEIITPTHDGLLVPMKDPAALAEAILKVLENAKLARRLADGAQRRSRDFSIGNIVREYEQMFQDVSAGRLIGHRTTSQVR